MFGTDGVRGRVGVEPITPTTILKLGWAAGKVFSRAGAGDNVLIGKDTRVSGYLLESALEAGFSAAGVNISLLGPMPTPGIAYLTRTARACAGVVISASHNPFYDNGIKIFSSDGTKLQDKLVQEIDDMMLQPIECVDSSELGKAKRFPDAYGRYIEYCKHTFDQSLSLEGLKVVIDCANGAAYDVAPNVLDELGAEVIAIGNHPDGFNINDNCGSTHLESVVAQVRESGADIGIALDGDADRVLLVDEQGNTINGDQILYILACHRLDKGALKGGVVGTLMTNLGLELALQDRNIPFTRARVGDRHVHEKLTERGWILGGEASGHIICLDKSTTGDGIVAALEVLEVMLQSGKSLSQLVADVTLFPQLIVNVPIGTADGKELTKNPRICDAVADAESRLGKTGRVVLRPSGTEPLFRVMLEGWKRSPLKLQTESGKWSRGKLVFSV
jgi:phosphoglucosamine mutase